MADATADTTKPAARSARAQCQTQLLIENSLMLSAQPDRRQLLRHLMIQGQRLLHCDACTMYLVTEQQTLRFELRIKADDLPAQEIPLYHNTDGTANEQHASSYFAIHNRPVVIDDIYQETHFDLSGTRAFDAATNDRTLSMLCVPMAPHNVEVIGVLQFMNAIDVSGGGSLCAGRNRLGSVAGFASGHGIGQPAIGRSAGQTDGSMIRVIATAIDAKSPYTGRHCERVPELAFMLAEAACAADQGPLADFNFHSEEEWQESGGRLTA